ncbi:BTB/POZ domain-containing protein 2 [Folsomia candida]|uniref:BTB/POZ domain-containing protein 2 n=1 Tax=Folsomia candida TaxID=158441 RepID=A0A226EXN3_FOLCA|nr:BTB/POZ domain-containing protein 2 [Folsomia candida]
MEYWKNEVEEMAVKRDMKYHSLSSRMDRMLKSGLYSDVAIIVGKDKTCFNVHKVVLGSCSPVLQAMVEKRWNDDQETASGGKTTLTFPDHRAEEFQLFLKFLYTDELGETFLSENLEILKLAHIYDIPPLLEKVSSRLSKFVEKCDAKDSDFCLQIYTTSRFIDECLSDKALQFFLRNIRSAAENDQYLEWDAETVRTVLTQQVLNIREVDLFKALLKWGNQPQDPTNLKSFPKSEAMPELLKLIRFGAMEMSQFADEVVPTGVLSKDEIVKIFKHFSSQKCTHFSDSDSIPRHKGERINRFALQTANRAMDCPIKGHSTSKDVVKTIPPDIRLVVKTPVYLRGIDIFCNGLNEILPIHGNYDGSIIFKVLIKDTDGRIVKKAVARMLGCTNAEEEIQFKVPLLLQPATCYDFYVTCTKNKGGIGRLLFPGESVRVYYRREVNPPRTRREKVTIYPYVKGTITYYGCDADNSLTIGKEFMSCWIRNLIFEKVPDELKPCIIT